MADDPQKRLEMVRALADLTPYPAVLLPVRGGGYEVLLCNFAGARAYGVKRETALQAGAELLTAEVYLRLKEGQPLPRASEPYRLHADPDEPPGTELVLLEADKGVLHKRLGLAKKQRANVLSSLGTYGKQ